MFSFFIADNQCPYFATLKPQLKDFSTMKKLITYNSAQNWVSKIVTPWHVTLIVRSQPSTIRTKT